MLDDLFLLYQGHLGQSDACPWPKRRRQSQVRQEPPLQGHRQESPRHALPFQGLVLATSKDDKNKLWKYRGKSASLIVSRVIYHPTRDSLLSLRYFQDNSVKNMYDEKE